MTKTWLQSLPPTNSNELNLQPRYTAAAAADIIKTWNIEVLRFQKNVRHGDRAQFEAMWAEVDKHLEGRQSKLAY